MTKVKKVAKKWEIWNKEEKVVKSEEKAKRLVSERFHKQIHIFGKKASKRMPTRKLWDYTIDTKKRFVLRKEKVYPLLKKEKEEMHKFISEQLRKEYIRPSQSPQTALVFFVGKKNRKKWIVQYQN